MCGVCLTKHVSGLDPGKAGNREDVVLFTSVVARVAKLSRSPEQTFVFSSCCSATVLTRAPLAMTLPAFAFIAFFIGAMVAGKRLELVNASELATLSTATCAKAHDHE